MVASRAVSTFTEKEYLALEAVADVRHEFLGGEIRAMAGAELDHNQICTNVRMALGLAYGTRPCRVIGADQRVKVEATSEYFYPDVVVVCRDPQLVGPAPRSLINAEVIIEVLSSSTERYDRGDKWVAYQSIPTLTDYVLVASERRRVEVFQRESQGGWIQRVVAPDARLSLSDGTMADVAALYRLVNI